MLGCAQCVQLYGHGAIMHILYSREAMDRQESYLQLLPSSLWQDVTELMGTVIS